VTVRYRPDYAGTRQLMNGAEMQAMLRGVGEEVMARAVSAAPVYEGKPRRGVTPGEYKGAFHVEVHANGGIHEDRAEALVINDSGHSVLVEDWDEFHTLRDAAAELEAL
jgi:hypothetical protein